MGVNEWKYVDRNLFLLGNKDKSEAARLCTTYMGERIYNLNGFLVSSF